MATAKRKFNKKSAPLLSGGNSIKKKYKSPRIDFSANDPSDEESDGPRRGDEIVDSDDEVSVGGAASDDSSDEDEKETVDAKKIRLARQYLSKVEEGSDSGSSSDDEEESDVDDDEPSNIHDKVGRKLARDRLKREGMLERRVASHVAQGIEDMRSSVHALSLLDGNDFEGQAKAWVDSKHVKYVRGHDLTPTCVTLSPSGEQAYSGSKDNSVIAYDVERGCRITNILPQWKQTDMEYSRGGGEILSLACSDDGRYLAVGGRDAAVKIFDIRIAGGKSQSIQSASPSAPRGLVTTFTGHKGPVTTLAFRSQSLQLFSGSDDRCIR
eukprot:scaffold76765_cov46-Attheya_sp.AAC.1